MDGPAVGPEAFLFLKQTIMKTTTRILSFTLVFLLGWVARGADIGFIEKFALAPDRQEALKLLIPGTAEYYYYHSLDAQLRGDGDRKSTRLNSSHALISYAVFCLKKKKKKQK